MKYLVIFIIFTLSLSKIQASTVVLFDSKDVLVEANYFGSKNLWICFDHVKWLLENDLQEGSLTYAKLNGFRWGNPHFIEKKIDSINMVNHTNHFWQTPDMIPAIDKIHEYIQSLLPHTYEQIITFGMCHGGTGAVLFSERLKATRVFAMVPQLQFNDPERLPELGMAWSMWKKVMGLKQIFPFPRGYKGCEYYIMYGHNHPGDSMIIQDPKGLPAIVDDMKQCHIYPFDSNTHMGISKIIRTTASLQAITDSVGAGDFDGIRLQLSSILIPSAQHPDYKPTAKPASRVFNIDPLSANFNCMGLCTLDDKSKLLEKVIFSASHLLWIYISNQLNQIFGTEIVTGVDKINYQGIEEIKEE